MWYCVVEPTVPNISKDDGDHSFEMRRITPPMMQQHIAGNMNPQHLSTSYNGYDPPHLFWHYSYDPPSLFWHYSYDPPCLFWHYNHLTTSLLCSNTVLPVRCKYKLRNEAVILYWLESPILTLGGGLMTDESSRKCFVVITITDNLL